MYLLVPLGREGQDDDSCGGRVSNGGLWWPEGTSKVVAAYIAAAATVAFASPESVA